MREVTFKHLTSIQSRKKDIVLREVFEKDGVVARTERRCFYFIKDIAHIDEDVDLENWINQQETTDAKSHYNKRHFHILKEHNDGLGEDKLICKIAGTFYAVVGRTIYSIGFLHSFKVDLVKVFLTK